MGTFKRQNMPVTQGEKKQAAMQESALVGAGVTFKGDMHCPSTVRIDGRVEGDIYTDGILVIGEKAMVTGNIHAGSVVCQGMLSGDIVAKEEVEMVAPASFNGSVQTPLLSIEEGVLFNDNLATTYTVEELSDDEPKAPPVPSRRWELRLT